MNNILKSILIKNSNLLRKNKINLKKLFDDDQIGGGKKLTINYENHQYIFKESSINNHYILKTQDDDECIYIIISQDDNVAEIHGLGNYKSCLQETNQNVGSTLLKITLKLLKKYKDRFNIKMVILTDNSVKKCNKNDIKLGLMLTMLTGDTWYGKYGFRPIKIKDNTYIFDEFEYKKYEQNKQIMLTIKITDINLLKYIKLTNNQRLINATEKIIKSNPTMLLKDFLFNLLRDYDKTCEYFNMFYESLFNKISVYDPHRKFYGLKL